MIHETSWEQEERALVLGSMLDSGRGTVLVVEERTDLREQVALRLLSAGYRIVAGRTQTCVARDAVGERVAAVVASAGGWFGAPTPQNALDLVRVDAPLVLLVSDEAAASLPSSLPSGTLVVRSDAPPAEVEERVVAVLEETACRVAVPVFARAISRFGPLDAN